MIKKAIFYTSFFLILYLIGVNTHQLILNKQEQILPFSLVKVYRFHAVFSALICINFIILSTVDKIFEQLGFVYLGVIILKLVLFALTFYKPIISDLDLSISARISLIIPTFIFLLTEAFFVIKILKIKDSKK